LIPKTQKKKKKNKTKQNKTKTKRERDSKKKTKRSSKKKKNENRERLVEEKKILLCSSKISNCHIPSNSNLKNSIFFVFKYEIP
jgi:hypothetical protein